MTSNRRTDPGNPRETILPPIHIYPGKGKLAEYRITVNVKGEKDYMLLDAAGPKDALRIAKEYLYFENGLSENDYILGKPRKTKGVVTWTGPREGED